MKSTKQKQSIFTFTSGVLMGILLIGIYSFTMEVPNTTPVPDDQKIDVETANKLFLNYFKSAPSQNKPFIGFAVSRDELKLISSLLTDTSLKGCRVYMGKDKNNNDVRMVVGVNKTGDDMISKGIYKTTASFSSPCPPVCDAASPITLH